MASSASSASPPTSRPTSPPPASQPAPPLPPNPNFKPFFPLITTPTSTETFHPHTHYIFASDPPDSSPLTAAALYALSPSTSSHSPASPISTDEASPSNPPALNPTSSFQHRKNETVILLDVDATGTKVLKAQSLSPDFAVTGTKIEAAPTRMTTEEGEAREGGLMLKIEGVEGNQSGNEGEKGKEKEGRTLESLMEEYEVGMRELRRVVEAGT